MKLSSTNIEKICLSTMKKINFSTEIDEIISLSLQELKIDKKFHDFIKESYFPDGLDSLMFILNKIIDKKMGQIKPKDFNKFRTHEKITYFVFKRLKVIEGICDKKTLFFLMTKPRYLKTSNKILFNIADEIWFLSGDRSTDMNYYSKRIILMNVYASVFSYFVFDKSKNAHKTLNFLERKINFVLTFGKMKGKLQSFFSR